MAKTTLELLPTWAECDRQINQSGKQGVSALMVFIHEFDPMFMFEEVDEGDFFKRLAALIDEISGIAINKHYIGSNKK